VDFLRFREETTCFRLKNGLQDATYFEPCFEVLSRSLLEQVQGGDYITLGM